MCAHICVFIYVRSHVYLSDLLAKQTPNKKPTKRKRVSRGKTKKPDPKNPKKPEKAKRSLEMTSDGSDVSSSGPFKKDSTFTLEALLRSYENPKGNTTPVFLNTPVVVELICLPVRLPAFVKHLVLADDLFVRSLKAEVTKKPLLLKLEEKDAPRYAPQHKFGRRRKGFHKARALERVLVLECFRWMTIRGEYFVLTKTKNSTDVHDGFQVFAHGFFLKYASICQPMTHVLFHRTGYVKSNDKFLWKLGKFVRHMICCS